MANLNTAVKVNYNKVTGKLKHAQHGSNSCPCLSSHSLIDFSEEFKKMNFWGTRTHDWALWNSGQRMIDTHFIFPLMKLDPADPTNYYFRASDDIIKLAHGCNMRVFYRLGTSIEHTSFNGAEEHYNTLVPDDFEKYAEVLAGIIRHYTKGWADGFEYEDMQYWEIWNEPDLTNRMWCGNMEQFIKFFVVVLKRLKAEFPELKIGGPAMTWLDKNYFTDLLNACKEAGVAPDFISWHYYGSNVEQLVEQPVAARQLLDDLGFTKTETCINEWHYLISWDGVQSSASTDLRQRAMLGPCGLHGIDSGCFNLAVLTGWQSGPLDTGFYYGSALDGAWGFRDENRQETKNSHSMKMFGRLLEEADEMVEATPCRAINTIYTLAAKAKNGKDARMLVTDYRGESETIEIEIEGLEDVKDVSATIMDNEHNQVPATVYWKNNTLTLVKNHYGSAAFYVTFER